MMKVSSVIVNYCHYLSEKKPEAFLKLVFPKLYGVHADEADQNGIVEDNEDLETGKDLIDIINDWAKKRGHFKKGSNINPVYADKLSKEQEKKAKEEQEKAKAEEETEDTK
jgi:ribosomal protein L12E/L44/L45/RPP1/RPP2